MICTPAMGQYSFFPEFPHGSPLGVAALTDYCDIFKKKKIAWVVVFQIALKYHPKESGEKNINVYVIKVKCEVHTARNIFYKILLLVS